MTDTATTGTTVTEADRQAAVEALMTDGIIARKGAFSREFVQRMREDVDAAFEEARSRENGAVGRGPNRWYVEIHPQALRGFVELVDHPWVRAVAEGVLGPDYKIVELGFDVPFSGAMNQPWHRDFPMPPETRDEHRLSSLAFNMTLVDTEEDMGPFEIAPARSGTAARSSTTRCSRPSPSTDGTRSGRSASTRRWATSPPGPR